MSASELFRLSHTERMERVEEILNNNPKQAPILVRKCIQYINNIEEELVDCRMALKEINASLEELMNPPLEVGVIVDSIDDKRFIISIGHDRRLYVKHPQLSAELRPGDVVAVSMSGAAIVDRFDEYPVVGILGAVAERKENTLVIEAANGTKMVVNVSDKIKTTEIKSGDLVLYDDRWKIALEVKERPKSKAEPIEKVDWAAIGGLDDVINEIRFEFESRCLDPDRVAAIGLEPLRGATLVGPPGVGKTMLAKALATWLQSEHKLRVIFKSIAPGSWRDPFYGVTERNVVEPIHEARELLENGEADMVILFYDELDSFGSRCNDVTGRIDSRVLTAFLAALDGISGRHRIVVMGATNRVDLVDEGLLRPGRFGDLIVQVPRPGRLAVRDIFRRHLRPPVKFADDNAKVMDKCVDAAMDMLFGSMEPPKALVELTLANGTKKFVWPKDILSGAVVANIVRRAKKCALRRGLGKKDFGLVPDDFVEATNDELLSLASKMTEPGKVNEMLGTRLNIVNVMPIRV